MQRSGFHEVVLSGINLGDYRTKDGKRFYDVVKLINDSDLDMRFRISSIEPNLLKDEILEEVLSEGSKFCQHFHIPLQSGSQELLYKMHRRYKADYYENLIKKIKSINSDVAIGADVIVGFPGENEERFLETYNLIMDSGITYLHVFTYSERENTPAASMPDVIPFDVRQQHNKRLRELSEVKKLDFYKTQVGTIRTVIPEQYNSDNGLWKGFTENYVQVNFQAPENLVQNPIQVSLERLEESKMYGSLVDTDIINMLSERTHPKSIELEVISL
jgi:threonylcarbamoyladenosine tRNA methylthiotransferase MtaB